jgi:hypothetical protein
MNVVGAGEGVWEARAPRRDDRARMGIGEEAGSPRMPRAWPVDRGPSRRDILGSRQRSDRDAFEEIHAVMDKFCWMGWGAVAMSVGAVLGLTLWKLVA